MFMFSSRNDFKILSEVLLILDFVIHIHHCIRLHLIKIIVTFSFLHIFYFLVFENSHDKGAVKYFGYEIHKHSSEVKNEYVFGNINITFVYFKHKNSRRRLSFQQ